MASLDLYSFFLLSFPLFFAAFQFSGATSCATSCGNQVIRFPFKLKSQPDDRCGYPGFDLECNNGQTILSLPNSGEFIVGNIDYSDQTIFLDDPNNCVPKRLLLNDSFSAAGSPFQEFFPQSLTFFNCSSDDVINGPGVVGCLSNENFTVVVVPTDYYISGSMQGCSKIATVVAPLWSDPNLGIMLSWAEPDCRYCERNGGICQFADNNTGQEIGCLGGSGNGLSKGMKYGLIFGLGVPFLIIVAVTITLRDKISGRSNPPHGTTSSSIVLGGYPLKGLDGRTIGSYPVTILGGSRRLPKPDNNTCSICLSEYEAKETLRTIPECQHYFHADCLDEWLRLNGTCPLCRNTP